MRVSAFDFEFLHEFSFFMEISRKLRLIKFLLENRLLHYFYTKRKILLRAECELKSDCRANIQFHAFFRF